MVHTRGGKGKNEPLTEEISREDSTASTTTHGNSRPSISCGSPQPSRSIFPPPRAAAVKRKRSRERDIPSRHVSSGSELEELLSREEEEESEDSFEEWGESTVSEDEGRDVEHTLTGGQNISPSSPSHQHRQRCPPTPFYVTGAATGKYNWTSNRPTNPPIPFTDTPGINIADPGEDPRKYFDLLLTEDVINLVVTETNRQADYLISNNVSPKARVTKWKPVSVQEFLTFLGILFHTGTCPLTRISDYWRTDILFNFPCFKKCIGRDRFAAILQALHFAKNPDPGDDQPIDRLYKIRPLMDIFHNTMDTIVTPTQRVCINESMVLWRGRLIFSIHMKGIKLYMLTEPSGLVLRFMAYTGSSDPNVGRSGHIDSVVWKLMEGRLDSGRSLFMDNYYNSVDLAHRLLDRGIYCTGTLRANRKGNPPDITVKKLKRGEVVDAYTSEGVCVMKWKDKRDVLMISSEFGSSMVDVRRQRGGGITSKPEAIAHYNETMSGIDQLDQMMSYYPIERKTLKWYKKVGIHILHLILVNSYFLYCKSHPKIPLYDFRLSVIKTLLSPSFSEPIPRTSPSLPSRSMGLSKHYPQTYDIDEKRKRVPQRRCTDCTSRGFRKDTKFFCPACEGCPPLCFTPCFMEFHKNKMC